MTAAIAARMRAVLAVTAVVLAAPIAVPAASAAEVARPDTRAGSTILIDAATGEVLLEEAADERRSIASTTKLMTALLALERAEPSDVFTAPAYRALPVESKINLREGERMKVADLLEALLLESANDAAVTIAENVAGSRADFIAEMNARARALGLSDTSYANPIGLDEPGNYSTARDLATLARMLLRNERFARVVDMPSAVLESGARRRTVGNRNRLVLDHPFVNGVKTGRTRRAGYVLVGSASGRGAQVISVVLGEPTEAARDADSLALLRYGLDRFRRVPAIRAGRTAARAEVRWFGGRTAALVPARGLAITIRRGERLRTVVDAPDELEGPLPKGERVGWITVVHRGRTAGTVPLVTAGAVPEAGTLRKLEAGVGVPLISLLILATVLGAMLVSLRIRSARRRRARA